MHHLVEPWQFKAAMRRLAGGVTIVATAYQCRKAGLTATAVCSVSAEPPSLLASVNRRAVAHDLIRQSRIFSINILGRADADLAKRFGGQAAPDQADRFAAGAWGVASTGAPILLSSIASFECELLHAFEMSTHTIFVGCVVATHESGSPEPLLYADGNYARLATL
jgi:flavin reductase (DIM6/NTAB) family NADH-FMN oxidoreductase RutF